MPKVIGANLGPLPGPKPQTFRPGNCANPKGRPKGAPELKLRGLLGRYLNEIVTQQVPDCDGNQHVVEISRMELLVRLMVATVFNPDSDDHPGFRQECLKQILARIDPTDVRDTGLGKLEIVVKSPAAFVYAKRLEALERRDGESTYRHVLEVLRTMPIDAMTPMAETTDDEGMPLPD